MANELRRFRVRIANTEYLLVDVLASDRYAAMERGVCIDPDHLRAEDVSWDADDAWEIAADEFEPPDLPASAWIAS